MIHAKIKVYTHNFSIEPISSDFNRALIKYAREFYYEQLFYNKRGEVISDNSRIFAAATKDRTVYRFHYNTFFKFIDFLERYNYRSTEYEIEYHNNPTYGTSEFPIRPMFQPREYQIPVIDYIASDKLTKFKLLALNTGEGKTISAFFGMQRLKLKTAVVLRSGYIERWKDEIEKVFEPSIKCVMIVGSDQLKSFINGCIDNSLDYDIALISNKTMQRYLTLYEGLKEGILQIGYGCAPYNFFETIHAGMRIIDETHQDFHFNFKLDLYTNVQNSLSLSATLVSRDRFIENMYEIAYPKDFRYHTVEMKKFIRATVIYYSTSDKARIKSNRRGSNAYNHIVYEDSITKNKKYLNQYLEMIRYYVEHFYIQRKAPEDKLIIFAASVHMCSEIADYLKKKYPFDSIAKYTGEDDYCNLIEPSIRVTTPSSGGTAHDIPNLTTIFMTMSIDSIQTSLQVVGRLRYIPNKDLLYAYMVDTSIPKQVQYHVRRKKLLKERVLSLNETFYQYTIGD